MTKIFRRIGLITFLLAELCLGTPRDMTAKLTERYMTVDEISAAVESLQARFPHEVTLKSLGLSQEGRPIRAIVLEKSLEPFRHRKNVLIDGAHHGDEWPTASAIVAFANKVLEADQKEPITSLLRDYRYYLIPVVNPDGYSRRQRASSNGVDLNRDYALNTSHKSGFTTPETRSMRRLLETGDFFASITLHSGSEAVLWPWGHSILPSPDHRAFEKIGKKIAKSMGYNYYMQSFHDYHTTGEFIDFAYHKYGILSLTLEISSEHMPQEQKLSEIIDRSIRGLVAFSRSLDEVDSETKVVSSH